MPLDINCPKCGGGTLTARAGFDGTTCTAIALDCNSCGKEIIRYEMDARIVAHYGIRDGSGLGIHAFLAAMVIPGAE